MLINADAKALEWICALFLSQDEVGIQEQINGEDIHTNNQRGFGLPTRLAAKTYLFRLIYGGSAYSYSVDPDFADISTSERYWQSIIDATYDKYRGLAKWHVRLMQEATTTGKLVMPTGRMYNFKPTINKRGENVWPRTTILNYPVQGLGADVMALIRTLMYARIRNEKGLIVSTVHDSILIDAPWENTEEVVKICFESFRVFPDKWKAIFGTEWNVPLKVEVQTGSNWGTMEEVTNE